MAKEVNKAATEDVAATSTKAVETVEVKETEKVEEKVVFKAADGTKHELLVNKFLFKGQRYESAIAVKENKDVLEHLVELNSRIFKKV